MPGNKTLIFKKVPTGLPVAGEHLVVEDRDFDKDAPAPEGGITAEVLSVSLDPYMRGRMRDRGIKSYIPAFEIDGPMGNFQTARVLKSATSDFSAGDIVAGVGPIAEYVVYENPAAAGVTKIQNPHGLDLDYFIGPLGMPGITAWSGLYKIGQPKKGETIFVSSAAGAVGQVVGQIAKHEGLTVIGSCGSDEKVDFVVKDLGFDHCFNYKKEKPADALKRLAPKGIDIYFENVGGDHLEAALDAMNDYGRIPVCGMINDYNTPREKHYGVKNLFNVVAKSITMIGYIQGRPGYADAYRKEHQEKMQKWLADGTFKAKLAVTEGIDNAAAAFIGMLQGENFGKAVVKVKAQ